MNCLYCNQNLPGDHETEYYYTCTVHPGWDVKYFFYNSVNSTVYLEPTLAYIGFSSVDEKYFIKLNVLEQTTLFKRWHLENTINAYASTIAFFPEWKYISPDNASQWIERLLSLKSFL